MPAQEQTFTWFDMTLPSTGRGPLDVIPWLNQIAKQWVFQLELPDTEDEPEDQAEDKPKDQNKKYEHYQIRIAVHKRCTQRTLVRANKALGFKEAHVSVTSTNAISGANSKFTYVMKYVGRVAGPWSNKDNKAPQYIPLQYKDLEKQLYPWQQVIWDATARDFRNINCIVDVKGRKGKSTIASLMELHGKGIDLPPMNDSKELIQAFCDILIGTESRDPKVVFMDLPRAMPKSKLSGMYTAIEQIKKGKVTDGRYRYQQWWFISPIVWVFTNTMPKIDYLSRDRWRFWNIVDNKLVQLPFDGEDDEDDDAELVAAADVTCDDEGQQGQQEV